VPWHPFRRRRRIGPGGRTIHHPPDRLSPAEAEERIAREPNEWLYVYAPDGRQIGRFEGTPDNVDLSPDLMGFTDDEPPRSVLQDCLVVHSHPPNQRLDSVAMFPPSADYLMLVVDRDVREWIVVSGAYRYVIRRPGAHWIGDDQVYRIAFAAIREELATELGPAEQSPAEAVARQHLILARLRDNGWIDYERSARPG
jgi:hypothetical protein